MIFNINGQEVEFRGDYPTLMTKHKDTPGMISKISTILFNENINIGTMKLYRDSKGTTATMALETDSELHSSIIEKLEAIPEIYSVKIINPITEGDF